MIELYCEVDGAFPNHHPDPSQPENLADLIKAVAENGADIGFSFDGEEFHCREGYVDAEGLLAHLENVGALLQEVLQMADITRLEVHGPEAELAKLRGPLADLSPRYFTLEYGFRR